MKKIKSALISVYYKDGLERIVRKLAEDGVAIYSTGGTLSFIESLGLKATSVESLTGYPSILGRRSIRKFSAASSPAATTRKTPNKRRSTKYPRSTR